MVMFNEPPGLMHTQEERPYGSDDRVSSPPTGNGEGEKAYNHNTLMS